MSHLCNYIPCRIFFLNPRSLGGHRPPPLIFVGGWLLTSPEEELNRRRGDMQPVGDSDSETHSSTGGIQVRMGVRCLDVNGSLQLTFPQLYAHTHTPQNLTKTRNQTRSNLGTTRSYGTVDSNPSLTPPQSQTYSAHSNGSSGEVRVAIKMNSALSGRDSAIMEESENSDPEQL